jgi:hypothetical protein
VGVRNGAANEATKVDGSKMDLYKKALWGQDETIAPQSGV